MHTCKFYGGISFVVVVVVVVSSWRYFEVVVVDMEVVV